LIEILLPKIVGRNVAASLLQAGAQCAIPGGDLENAFRAQR
jgi:hypothetical protein